MNNNNTLKYEQSLKILDEKELEQISDIVSATPHQPETGNDDRLILLAANLAKRHKPSGGGEVSLSSEIMHNCINDIILRSMVVNKKTYNQRLAVCAACEHQRLLRVVKLGQRRLTKCHLCKCVVNAKAYMRHAECPIGKWHQHGLGLFL